MLKYWKMASIAGLYSFGARGRGGEDHGGDHRGDHTDRGGAGFRGGLFKKGRLGCSNINANNTSNQNQGWFGALGTDHSGETHITGITGTSELLDGEDLLTLGDREQ